jgi:DNA topoisomerase-1
MNRTLVDVTSSDVNDYLRQVSGRLHCQRFPNISSTVLAVRSAECEVCIPDQQTKLLKAAEAVARMLGNTPTICQRCYVHPVVVDSLS